MIFNVLARSIEGHAHFIRQSCVQCVGCALANVIRYSSHISDALLRFSSCTVCASSVVKRRLGLPVGGGTSGHDHVSDAEGHFAVDPNPRLVRSFVRRRLLAPRLHMSGVFGPCRPFGNLALSPRECARLGYTFGVCLPPTPGLSEASRPDPCGCRGRSVRTQRIRRRVCSAL